jgi:hypothetical protein
MKMPTKCFIESKPPEKFAVIPNSPKVVDVCQSSVTRNTEVSQLRDVLSNFPRIPFQITLSSPGPDFGGTF